MIDFKKINSDALSIFHSLVSTWIPGGKMEGVEYVVCNPNRPDKTAGSFKVNTVTGIWSDFACNVGGADTISLYAYVYRVSQKEAAETIQKQIGYTPIKPFKDKYISDWKVIETDDNCNPMPTHRKYKVDDDWKEDKIEKVYPYKTLEGKLIGYTALCRKENGGKDVIPYRYSENAEGKKTWRQKGFEAPRPLYNQERLIDFPSAQILLVEGEKCCDYASKLFEGYNSIIPISWIGGVNSVLRADWSVLKGRKIIFWPDADSQKYPKEHIRAGEQIDKFDQPGIVAMIKIYNLCKKDIIGGKFVDCLDIKKQGWDIADFIDEGATRDVVLNFIKSNMKDFPKIGLEAQIIEEPIFNTEQYSEKPFQFLGFGSQQGTTVFYYLPKGTHKVVELAPCAHSKMNLISLADESWFETNFPTKNGWNVTGASNWMIRCGEKKGIYDPSKIRGRGAWFDAGRTVLHLGNRLIVDNQKMAIDEIISHHVYEAGIPIESDQFSVNNILGNTEASELLKMCDLISWQQPISAKLYAGWLALAPICGAIDWRPHLWLTGESGTGKTWIQENLTAPILGDCCLNASSNTSEPGLRQTLGYDAFPVVFDEIETEDQASFNRVQNIIELARQASSNKSSHIYKGSASGKAVSYAIRSPFLFSSINPKLVQQADKNRITTLKLKKRTDSENEKYFTQIVSMVVGVITPEWSAKLRGRSIFMIPTIKKNIEIFGRVMSRILKSKRHGDQIGTLLAGAWSLKSDEIIDFNVAEKFCSAINWLEETELEESTDHDACLTIIMQQLIPVNGFSDKRSIGGLIKDATQNTSILIDPQVQSKAIDVFKTARDALRKYGITTIKNREGGMDIAIAENHSMLASLLENTPWHSSYKHVLMRIDGSLLKTAVFADQVRSRAICIPAKNRFEDDDFSEELTVGF